MIVYLTWYILYCVLSTLLFIQFMHVTSHPVYFYSSIVVYVHTVYARAPSPFILHIHWVVFDDLGFLHSDIPCFILLFRCSMRLHMLRGVGVSLLGRPFSVYCLSFIHVVSLIPYTGLLSYFFRSYAIIVLDIYILYCNNIVLL